MTATPPLFGLVLAGGASTRMQRDKAALTYHGKTQLQWTYDLVSQLCAATFVSVRPDQRSDSMRAAFPQIVDRQPGIGPIAGISAALQDHPKAAWLVVACDLPFITADTLQHLITHRDPQRMATAYRSNHDGLPEPLCAIWEPQAAEAVRAYLESGKQCPRKLLINSDVALLNLPDTRALDNVNTPAEFEEAAQSVGSGRWAPGSGQKPQAQANGSKHPRNAESSSGKSPEPSGPSLTLRIQYYAILREQAGRSEEMLDTAATTPTALFEELRQRHPFQLTPAQLKVAINADFRDWNTPLRNGDTVVFIPPVAGG